MKLTPLNITLACLLVWSISESQTEEFDTSSLVWMIVLFFVLAILDLLFRFLVKDLKKLWFLQIGFILVVGILMVILKTL